MDSASWIESGFVTRQSQARFRKLALVEEVAVTKEAAKTLLNVGQEIKGRTTDCPRLRFIGHLTWKQTSRKIIITALPNVRRRGYICNELNNEMPWLP